MTIASEIFRAYDIRGIVDKTLTEEAVKQIGRALGSMAREQGETKIITARDGRLSGPRLLQALQTGLLESGCDVIDVGMVPTPLLYFATHLLETKSGVMLTGSHNPPEYNGIKMVIAGITLCADEIQQLRVRIEQQRFTSGHGKRTVYDGLIDRYIARVQSDVRVSRPLKIVIDCGAGVAGCVAPLLFRALGCEVVELFCTVDGRFPHHHPDPGKLENLQDLIATVQREKADVGLAFDGDADRLGVVTNRGTVIWPDRQLILYAKDILSRHANATIVYDVKCTRYLPVKIKEWGGHSIMARTGHSLIKAKLKETGALLAGEMSGHIFFKERWYGFDDALYTGARLLEILAKDARDCDTVFADIPNSVNTPELNVALTEEKKFTFMQALLKQAHFPGATVSTMDGVRADFADGFGLVRASNTTPCLVIRFEADNAAALQRIQNSFRERMLEIDSAMELPF